ncbi:MAG: hypothetical protein IT537_13415 [Hyphomicrobiales bacterium]|nr:hypothetical protein [Hyphomicrobiales bacterium]
MANQTDDEKHVTVARKHAVAAGALTCSYGDQRSPSAGLRSGEVMTGGEYAALRHRSERGFFCYAGMVQSGGFST